MCTTLSTLSPYFKAMENISKTDTMVHTPIIPVPGRLRQVDFKFEGSLCSIAGSRPVWLQK